MSAALTVFDVGLEAVTAIGELEFGGLGAVVLGQFVFFDFEVPPHISFGGKQAMKVHKLPGGERIVDLLGPDDRNLEWSGAFLGMDQPPSFRVQQLDQMRADGQPLPLVWGNYFYTVLIDSFEADDRVSGPLVYRISCLVLRNEATAPTSPSPDLTGTVTNDMNSAATSAATPAPTGITGALPLPPIPPPGGAP